MTLSVKSYTIFFINTETKLKIKFYHHDERPKTHTDFFLSINSVMFANCEKQEST